MNIFIVHKHGLHPRLYTAQPDRVLARVHNLLGTSYVARHTITVASTKVQMKGMAASLGTAMFKPFFTLNPEKPYGWWYFAHISWYIWRTQPDVVHASGWATALWGWMWALLSPETTYVWTVDSVPDTSLVSRFIAWQARYVFDAISCSSRAVQYHMLTAFNTPATYVPDGYAVPALPDIPPKQFGLRARQYAVALCDTLDDVKTVAEAYSNVKTRKTLVVIISGQNSPQSLTESSPAQALIRRETIPKRLQRAYPFLQAAPTHYPRGVQSLVRNAAAIYVMGNSPDTIALSLHAMDAERPIVALTQPYIDEILGAAAVYADADTLAAAIARTVSAKLPKTITQRLSMASARAKGHFTWEYIAQEYALLYMQPHTIQVPLDSLSCRQAVA